MCEQPKISLGQTPAVSLCAIYHLVGNEHAFKLLGDPGRSGITRGTAVVKTGGRMESGILRAKRLDGL